MAASPAFITMSEAWLRQWMLLIDGCERDVSYTFQPDFLKPKVRTKIQAKLVGGNFRMLIDSLGTPWQLRFTGPSILFLEEIGESAYAIDRLWAHLENAVDLSNLRAVLWGQCTDCKDHENALEMIRARSPILHVDGFPVGHGDISHAVMLNVRAELDASPDRASLRYLP
jgi:muramoyltetrapeptide carboxypeptidase